MATIQENTAGKIRDLPIKATLREVLMAAADSAGIEVVRVTSGGQCAKGTCTKRTGSTRHDLGNAADLMLLVGGQPLDFTTPAGQQKFAQFVTAACQAGATGVGAGVDYMGPLTVHIGFGTRAVWGAGGVAANAPQWIVDAAREGWQSVLNSNELELLRTQNSDEDEFEEDELTKTGT